VRHLMNSACSRLIGLSGTLRTLLVLSGLLVGLALSSVAQTSPSDPDSSLVELVHALPGTPLTLERATSLAGATSPTVRAAAAVHDAALGTVRHEGGAFDPVLKLGWDYVDQKLPSASFFAGAEVLHTAQGTGFAGLSWVSPIGTNIEATLDGVRLATNSGFAFLTPQYTTTGTLTIRQPLLRGFHTSARKALAGAELLEASSRERYEQEILALQSTVEQIYWDLYAGERDYAVQRLTRDRAAAFLHETELRAKAGFVGPGQVANAASFLADQEILLLDREEALDALSERLVQAIGVRPDQGTTRFKTIDQPPDTVPFEDPDRWVRVALERNRDLRALRSEIEARQVYSHAAAWEALPSLDLIGSLGGNGLGGDPRSVVFGADTLRTNVSGSLGDAIRQAVNREYPSWRVGLQVSVPIGLRSGLGEQDRLDAEVVIAEQRYAQVARLLEEEVRARCRELQNGQRRLMAARASVDAAHEQVRIVRIEYQNGRSTAFELVRVGADFAVAEQRYSQALVRSAKAAASLRQLTSGVPGDAGHPSNGM
jgi:outer membrane protein TolC